MFHTQHWESQVLCVEDWLNFFPWFHNYLQALNKLDIFYLWQGRCPTNWQTFKDMCYLPVASPQMNHSDALTYCSEILPGAHLVHINDMEERDLISQLMYVSNADS